MDLDIQRERFDRNIDMSISEFFFHEKVIITQISKVGPVSKMKNIKNSTFYDRN